MKGSAELGEILFECSKQHDKLLDWWKLHKNDEVFNTQEGKELQNHLGGILKQEGLAMFALSRIELMEAMKHPDLISDKTLKAFKEAIECMGGP